jgi:hypothetical protein
LNTSFGPIYYTANDRESRYNAFITSFNARFGSRGALNMSYTRSASRDDTQVYPIGTNPQLWYGPSVWDVPNRFSLSGSFQIPGLQAGRGVVGHLTDGWSLSGTTIVQSGYPFNVLTRAPFAPTRNAAGQITGFAAGSGDYNADGVNFDFPNVTSYTQSTSRQAFLNGVLSKTNFTTPALGALGNEQYDQFRNPSFFQSDVSLAKNTSITEQVKLELRFAFFNIFNRANLYNVSSDLSSGNFGKVQSQYNPRWIQLGAAIRF